MRKQLKYADIIKRIAKYDPNIKVFTDRGKGSHRMLFCPKTQRKTTIPDDREIYRPQMKMLIRQLGLPKDIFN